jgi:RNA recognition motif-containing protein
MVIYISNLGKKVTADSLELLFATHGIVSSTTLLSSKLNGGLNGEALVEMTHGHEAQHATYKLNGSIIDGHIMAVTTMNQAGLVDRLKNKLGNYEY